MSKAKKIDITSGVNGIAPLEITTAIEAITISRMVKNIETEKWDVNPEYQRGYRWSPKNKHELITSLLKGIPLPLFYLRNTGHSTAEVLDGKQRCLTICNFVNNKFAYNPGGGRLIYFRNLSKEQQQNILDTNIAIRYLYNTDDSAAIDIFIALQNGQRIRTEEMRHALGGHAISTIRTIFDKTEINKLKAFSRSADYTKHETLLTKFLYLEHVIDAISYDKNADIIDDNALYNMVKNYTNKKVPTDIVNRTIKRIKSIKYALKDIKNVLMPQFPMVYGTYLLAARLQDKYGMSELEASDYIYKFVNYIQELRVDYIAKIKDWNFKQKYPEADHHWYRITMENFGKRGTAKSETHIYTMWFEAVWEKFEDKYKKELKKLPQMMNFIK